jgi:hypothetical protein
MTEEERQQARSIAGDIINSSAELLSLLYDMDLMPEQVEKGSLDERNIVMIAFAWKHRTEPLTPPEPTTQATAPP